MLEGILESPPSDHTGAGVVICHPHPLYGGDMYNNVVAALSRGLSENGISAFRFNLRGVGQSGGRFDGGEGEAEDTAGALSYLSSLEEIDPQKVGLAGYSFGGMVALLACEKSELPSAIVVISPLIPRGALSAHKIPKLIIAGENDNVVPFSDIKQGAGEMAEPKRLEVIPGADHFWGGNEKPMIDLAVRFFQEALV